MRHFGSLIPSTNTTIEIEFNQLLPDTLQLHVGRLGKGGDTPFSPSLDADVEYQAKLLGAAKVEVISLAQTSASMFDDDYDAKAVRLMSKGSGVPALTSADAVGHAIQALDAKRVAIVSPYSDEVMDRTKRYYETRHGLEIVGMEGFGATDAYAIGALSEDHATAAFERIDRPEIEVLMVPGGNFPTMKFVAAWEEQFHKPVVTTNQAAVWAMLTVMKVEDPVPGLGRLLTDMPAARTQIV